VQAARDPRCATLIEDGLCVIEREMRMKQQFNFLTARDQRGNGDDAAITRRELPVLRHGYLRA
jgi:hypothetical protein